MSDQQPETEAENNPQPNPYYATGNKLEAHIIADMLRIESIATEMREHKVDFREFKDTNSKRLDKLENWIIAIVAIASTSLISILGAIAIGVLTR